MGNFDSLNRRVDKIVAAMTNYVQPEQPHQTIVFYDPETGEPVNETPETFQHGRVWLPVKEYVNFIPDDDGCEA